jgi:hypothetical protein
MPLSAGHKRNFNTLRRVFRAGDAALMECQVAATGETAAVICAVNRLRTTDPRRPISRKRRPSLRHCRRR